LTPRHAQKALPAGAGGWFERLEQAKSRLATVPVAAAPCGSWFPMRRKLAALIEKLIQSNTSWPTDLELLMTNAATALHDFAKAGALKDHVKKLEAQFGRDAP
jgi:hypothetical protein